MRPPNAQSELEIRDEFPLLDRQLDGRPLIYLDSAATSLKPRCVLAAEKSYATTYTANVHRGKHALSEEASVAFDAARRRVAAFLNAGPKSVVFVRGATEGINLVARGLRLSKEDKVLIPVGEHHSNIVPWMREASVVWLQKNPTEPLTADVVGDEIERHRPLVLALAYASNVTGAVHSIEEICRVARQCGVLTCIDASQAAPHFAIDVTRIDCDFLTFSGHKTLGPTGIGVLTGRAEALEALAPLVLGGGCIERVTEQGFTLKELPYRLEAGTPNISGAIGLAAALDFLEEVGFANIFAHQSELARILHHRLSETAGIRILMSESEPRLALASIAVPSGRIGPDELAVALSTSYAIMVRSGFHCAHPLFDRFGDPAGAVRASAYIYNTHAEIDAFAEALSKILRFYRA
jgi:cysteine desulfurase / selenocysteine lyase